MQLSSYLDFCDRMLSLRMFLVFVATCLYLPQSLASVVNVKNWDAPYAYLSDGDASVRKVLSDFSKSHGLFLEIEKPATEELSKAVLRSNTRSDNAEQFLDLLGYQNGFQWFVFNGTLYVTNESSVTERIELGDSNVSEFRSALSSIGLFESKFGWGEIPGQQTVLITGPSKYISLIKQTLNDNKSGSALAGTDKKRNLITMIFPLRYAKAGDVKVTVKGGVTTIPGVASVLSDIKDQLNNDGSKKSLNLPKILGSKNGMFDLSDGLNSLLPKIGDVSPMAEVSDSSLLASLKQSRNDKNNAIGWIPGDANDNRVNIVADIRTNSVVVVDNAEFKDDYDRIIKSLDIPQRVIQIEAVMIEYERSRLPQSLVTAISGGYSSKGTMEVMSLLLNSIEKLEARRLITLVSRQIVSTLENYPVTIDLNYSASDQDNSGGNSKEKEKSSRVVNGAQMYTTPRLVRGAGNGRDQIEMQVEILEGNNVDDAELHRQGIAGASVSHTMNTQLLVPDGFPVLVNTTVVRRARDVAPSNFTPSNNLLSVARRERAIFIIPRALNL